MTSAVIACQQPQLYYEVFHIEGLHSGGEGRVATSIKDFGELCTTALTVRAVIPVGSARGDAMAGFGFHQLQAGVVRLATEDRTTEDCF